MMGLSSDIRTVQGVEIASRDNVRLGSGGEEDSVVPVVWRRFPAL